MKTRQVCKFPILTLYLYILVYILKNELSVIDFFSMVIQIHNYVSRKVLASVTVLVSRMFR